MLKPFPSNLATEKEMEQMKTRAGNLSTEIKSKAEIKFFFSN